MARLTGARLILRALRREGVRLAFTLVGDTILPLCDLAEEEGLELVDVRHEASAVHMADAWARVTGEPAVVMTTGGPGFANAVSALPTAFKNESPVIFIAGCGPLAERGLDSFQEIDQVEMARPVAKGSWLVHELRQVPEVVARAFRTALSGRPGPVHLTVPLDLQEAAADGIDLPEGETRPRDRAPGDPARVREAVELLARAERPAVVAGAPARYQVDPGVLRAFLEETGLPLFTVESARGLVPDDHPLCFGYADPALNASARLLGEADAVLLLGKRLDIRTRYGALFHPSARLVQVDPEPTVIGRNRPVAVGIVGHLGAVVEQMRAEARGCRWRDLGAWRERLESARRAQLRELERLGEDPEAPLHPMRVFREVARLLREDDILVFDGGDFIQWGRAYLPARRPGGWLRLGPLGHLGAGLPFALAAQRARPEARVFLFIGDGSFGFYAIEFDTAVRHNLPIVAVLGNDAAWGIDKNFQLAYYGRAVRTDLRPVRYDELVRALGGHGEHVERAEELGPALERALASRRPALVDVRVRTTPSPLAQAMIGRRLGRG